MVGWRIALWAVIVLAALSFLFCVRAILLPFILALLLSVLLDPPIRKLRLKGMSRSAAVWTVMGSFGLIVVVAGILTVPSIAAQVSNLDDTVTQATNRLRNDAETNSFFLHWNPKYQVQQPGATEQIDKLFADNQNLLGALNLPLSRAQFVAKFIEPHSSEISNTVQHSLDALLGFITGFGSKAILLLFTPIFTLWILLDYDRMRKRSELLIPPAIRRDTMGLFKDIGEVFGRYLRGVATVLFYYFVIAALLLYVLGAPYSILLAMLFALIYLIPFLGPVINAGILFLVTMLSTSRGNMVFSMSNSLTFAITITGIYALIMLIFDQLVYARVVGKSVGLHPVISFFVVFSGAALFGPVGMILAFPVAGAMKVILDRLFRFTSKDPEELDLPAVPLRHRGIVQA
jgi:predicted PurR-regulated permease PerM